MGEIESLAGNWIVHFAGNWRVGFVGSWRVYWMVGWSLWVTSGKDIINLGRGIWILFRSVIGG